mmetsp:Transcript_14965/g.29117  ORF Transcript_14965/g.29117 Transcript_14965/m.29117 type:complete len:826 (+) Transcript_14965:128-2605(+)
MASRSARFRCGDRDVETTTEALERAQGSRLFDALKEAEEREAEGSDELERSGSFAERSSDTTETQKDSSGGNLSASEDAKAHLETRSGAQEPCDSDTSGGKDADQNRGGQRKNPLILQLDEDLMQSVDVDELAAILKFYEGAQEEAWVPQDVEGRKRLESTASSLNAQEALDTLRRASMDSEGDNNREPKTEMGPFVENTIFPGSNVPHAQSETPHAENSNICIDIQGITRRGSQTTSAPSQGPSQVLCELSDLVDEADATPDTEIVSPSGISATSTMSSTLVSPTGTMSEPNSPPSFSASIAGMAALALSSASRRMSEDTVQSDASSVDEYDVIEDAEQDQHQNQEGADNSRVYGEILQKFESRGDQSGVDQDNYANVTGESGAEAVKATPKSCAEDSPHVDSAADEHVVNEECKDEDEVAELERRIAELTTQVQDLELSPDSTLSLRAKESIKVELQKAKYERDQLLLAQRNAGKKLAFNLIVVGCTGQGKSSSLNMLLNRNVCRVSGAQAQGTRGCEMNDGYISDDHFVSFIDTQGLGADTSVTDTELLSKIMMSTESISKLRIINNVLISFDTNTRATPATMANELTLMELFGEMRQSCFLVFTKWNTNAVQVEWNQPLRAWCRRWRRADTVEEIDEEPPSYADMYAAYTKYILRAMNNDEDAGAFSKMGTFLSFFEARVVWAYNLDMLQIADMEDGELEPYIVKLYHHYREKAIQCLRQGSTEVPVSEISFLKEDTDTLGRVATRLVESRDEKIRQLERIGLDIEKRKEMCNVFTDMATSHYSKISAGDYLVNDETNHMDKIANLAGFSPETPRVGCNLM